MKTVNEVSRLTGLSVRALHYYDQIGLLPPAKLSEGGYRLYDEAALLRLEQILFFRELEFPLKDIRAILESPNFDRDAALREHLALLQLKRERLDGLISLAQNSLKKGASTMDLKAFDKSKQEEYRQEAKERWGNTDAYAACEKKTAAYGKAEWEGANGALMGCFKTFAGLLGKAPQDAAVQDAVKALQKTITDHFYPCTDEILAGLGEMYVGDERFKASIDAEGEGTAEFVCAAIRHYCAK